MEHAPSVGKVFFPLDEELELLPGSLAPRQQEHLVHLACFMPFDKVAEMMEELLSVLTTEETVRRLTEQVGGWMEDWQTAEVEAESSPESERERPLQRCVLGVLMGRWFLWFINSGRRCARSLLVSHKRGVMPRER